MPNRPLLPLILTVLALGACTPAANRWEETDANAKPGEVTVDQAGGEDRIVLFAPIALGALAEIYPTGRLELAHKMASYIDLLAKLADGRVGETLPESGSPAWDAGRVPAANGAHLVILSKVIELRRFEGTPDVHGSTHYQVAVVELRAVDVDGRLVLNRQIKGTVAIENRAKFSGPTNEPETLATWQALSTACGLVKDYLDANPELRKVPRQEVPNAPNLIEIAIDSEPAKADILVDGEFRGTTPQVIPLPAKELTISIERQGFQPWTRKVVPRTGMRIQPALVPLAASAVPAPAVAEPGTAK